MENDQHVLVDLYIPRHCSASNRLITAKDHASIQIAVANVDSNGKAIRGSSEAIVIAGQIRSQGESDSSINRLCQEKGYLKNVFDYRT